MTTPRHPQVFSDIALATSHALLNQAQKAQETLFAAASEQIDVQAKAFGDLSQPNPEAFWIQGAQFAREQADRAGRLMRDLGEIQIQALQDLGNAGRQTAEEVAKTTKGRK